MCVNVTGGAGCASVSVRTTLASRPGLSDRSSPSHWSRSPQQSCLTHRPTGSSRSLQTSVSSLTRRALSTQDMSVLSFLRQLTTWHCSRLQPSTGRAASVKALTSMFNSHRSQSTRCSIHDKLSLVASGPSAANLLQGPQQQNRDGETERQMDRRSTVL